MADRNRSSAGYGEGQDWQHRQDEAWDPRQDDTWRSAQAGRDWQHRQAYQTGSPSTYGNQRSGGSAQPDEWSSRQGPQRSDFNSQSVDHSNSGSDRSQHGYGPQGYENSGGGHYEGETYGSQDRYGRAQHQRSVKDWGGSRKWGRQHEQRGGQGQAGGSSPGYGSLGYGGYALPDTGSSGYEGGGLTSQTGQTHLGSSTWGSHPAGEESYEQQAGYGGYGGRSEGYGSQSSYGAHGGYGSQGHAYGAPREPQGGYAQQGGWAPGSGSWAERSQWQRRGPKGYKRSDERIREDIYEHLIRSAHIDAEEVTIDVSDGKVTIEGSVPERRMKHAIEDMAAACPGVNDVENRLRVAQTGHQWGSGGANGPTNTGTGSTTHGAGSTTGGTGTSSSTSPGGSVSGSGSHTSPGSSTAGSDNQMNSASGDSMGAGSSRDSGGSGAMKG